MAPIPEKHTAAEKLRASERIRLCIYHSDIAGVMAELNALGNLDIKIRGESLLRHSVIGADMEVVRYLINSRFNVNECDPKKGTLLHAAIISDNHRSSSQFSGMMLEAGADPNAASGKNGLPMAFVIRNRFSGSDAFLKNLVAAGASMDLLRDEIGEPVMDYAVKWNNVFAIPFLINHFSKIDPDAIRGALILSGEMCGARKNAKSTSTNDIAATEQKIFQFLTTSVQCIDANDAIDDVLRGAVPTPGAPHNRDRCQARIRF